MNRDKALSLAKKLANISSQNGSSEAEVEMATAQLAKLQAEHNISLLELSEEELRSAVGVLRDYVDDTQDHRIAVLQPWHKQTISVIADHFDCGWFRHRGMSHVNIVGYEADAKMAMWLIQYIIPRQLELYRKDRARHRIPRKDAKARQDSWNAAFTARIAYRLQEEYARHASSDCRALSVPKKRAVEDVMDAMNLSQTTVNMKLEDAQAALSGDQAAKQLNLSQQLNHNPSAKIGV